MSLQSKKSISLTVVLVILGVLALYSGTRWLAILVPAGFLVWRVAQPTFRSDRN